MNAGMRRGNVVTITINHRLGCLGFLHLADLGGSAFAKSGNVGILDAVAALERMERLRACLERLRHSPRVRRRDFDAFECYVIRDEPAETVAKQFGISRARLYGIRTEMMNRIRTMVSQLNDELGEV